MNNDDEINFPDISVKVDNNGNYQFTNDEDFKTNISLAKKRFLANEENILKAHIGYSEIELGSAEVRENNEKKLSDFLNQFLKMIFCINSTFLKSGEDYIEVINSLRERPHSMDVSDKTKIDIFRTSVPRISFCIYLTEDELKSLSNKIKSLSHDSGFKDNDNSSLSVNNIEGLILGLRISGRGLPVTIFNKNIMLHYVIPALIREMQRLQSDHNYDIRKEMQWGDISSYIIGLG